MVGNYYSIESHKIESHKIPKKIVIDNYGSSG